MVTTSSAMDLGISKWQFDILEETSQNEIRSSTFQMEAALSPQIHHCSSYNIIQLAGFQYFMD
jgi:hypothetical protein